MDQIAIRVANRFRTSKLDFREVVGKPAEANEAARLAFNALNRFKFAFDEMDEIPADLMPLYRQCMKALGAHEKFSSEVYQLKMMMSRTSL